MWRVDIVLMAALAACLVVSSAATTPKLRRAVVGDVEDTPLWRRWFIDWGGSLGRLPSRDDMIIPVDPSRFYPRRPATETPWEAYRNRLAREQAEYWNVVLGGHTP